MNLLINIADIVLLAMLLAIVCLYTSSENKILHLLPDFARNPNSIIPIFILAVLFIIKNISGYFIFHKQSRFFFGISTRLSRQQLFNYLNGSYEKYVQSERAQIINTVNHRPLEFAQNILTSIQAIFTEFSLIIITVIAILIFKPILFLLLLLFLFPPIILAGISIRKKANYIKQNISKDAEKATQYLNESFSGFIESNIYNKRTFFSERYLLYQKKLSSHISQLQIIQWLPAKTVEVFAVLGLFTLVLFNKFLGHQSNLLDIGAFIAAAFKIMPGVARIANASAILKTYEQVVAHLSTTEIPDSKTGSTFQQIDSIKFDNVDFAFKDKWVLQNFDTKIKSGDFVFISGPSGRGKTTFINLLLGLLSPTRGQIFFNEIAVSTEDIKSAYYLISYIKQQALIIQDSIQTNITLQDEIVNEERLRFAVKFAGLNPLINNFSDGLNTILADEGKNISGGQRQRIAIARALYRDTNLIVLDEPFNELDKDSEIILLEQLKQLASEGKIIVLISHSNLALHYCNKHLEF